MTDDNPLRAWLAEQAHMHAVLDRPTRIAGVRFVGTVVTPFLDVTELFGSSTGTFLSLGWGTHIRLEASNGAVSRAVHLKGSPIDPLGALSPAFRGRLRGILGWSPAAMLESDRRVRRLPGPPPELFAGADGLDLARVLIHKGRDWLSGQGRLRVGVTVAQADAVRAMIDDDPHDTIRDRRGRIVYFTLGGRQ
jgi:hypothetical protein